MVQELTKGRLQKHAEPWASLCAMALHTNDPARLVRNGAGAEAVIGNPPEGSLDSPDPLRVRPPFAAVTLDRRQRRLTLASDPFGLHPVYYAAEGESLVFCTKLNPLLRSGLVDWSFDPAALVDFFTYEHVTGHRTFADGVRVLPPGTVLQFHDGRVTLTPYREWRFGTSERGDRARVADRLFEALRAAVARSFEPGQRVAVTLSGGLDSRALLGCAVSVGGCRLRTYTFGTHGCPDVTLARRLARVCGVPNVTVHTDGRYLQRWIDHGVYVTGGMVNCIHYHILSLAATLRVEADVVLEGLGGDALTGGHLRPGMRHVGSKDALARAVYRLRATAWPTRRVLASILRPEVMDATRYDPHDAVRPHFEAPAIRCAWMGCHHFDLDERQRRFIQYGPHLLRPLVNVQTPFYDPEVTAILSELPASEMAGQLAYLAMHRRCLPALAQVPDALRGLPVSWPDSVRLGKRVFDAGRRRLPGPVRRLLGGSSDLPTDYAGWLRGQLRNLVVDRLLDPRTPLADYVQLPEARRLVDQHINGSSDHTTKIGCLLTFDAWLRSLKASQQCEVTSHAELPPDAWIELKCHE